MNRKPVTARTQEIRIATAMTGGVSLAIWMGGVARELNLMQQAAWRRHHGQPAAPPPQATTGTDANVRDLYVRLLDLLDVTVSIDMLSGTSAGGINGALLGLARVRSLDLGNLRDFWLKSGAFEVLLRDPKEKNPPSLMYGDGVLLKELRKGLAELKGIDSGYTRPTADQQADEKTRLFITTTLLTGEASRFTDAFGTQVQDVDHRGLFEFNETDLGGDNAFDLVALAARCSASYPAAFEPAFVSFSTENIPDQPVMRRHANITRNHWVADGGLLANRPINPLLQCIFDRPAHRQVRRVLLYVVPSPGEMPDPRESPPEKETFDAPWTLGEALIKDLGSMLGQSIAADLRTLQQHNDRVDSLRDTRLRMAEIGAMVPPENEYRLLNGTAVLSDYQAREATWLVHPVISALMKALTTMTPEQMPPNWREELRPGGSAERDCRQNAAQSVSEQWVKPAWGDLDALAAFGRPAFDGARATVIAILQAAYVAESSSTPWVDLSDLSRRVHAGFVPENRPDADVVVEDMLGEMASQDGAPDLSAFAVQAATEYVNQLAPSPADLTEGWRELASIVKRLAEICPSADAELAIQESPFLQRPSAEQRKQRAARELGVYLAYLTAVPDTIPFRLFELHVATRSVLPVGGEIEQPVELIQVSADTRSTIAPERFTAAKKLTGMQLHHFGAFYKSSWRANDWTWGRLDGAGWLVHMLLDPRRIETLTETENVPVGHRAEWFYGKLRARVLGGGTEPENWSLELPGEDAITINAERVMDELRYLDKTDLQIPDSLPLTSLWVARRWQEWIAAHELPSVAAQMLGTPATQYAPWAVDTLRKAGNPDMAVTAARAATAAVQNGNWNEEHRKLIAALVSAEPATVLDLEAAQKIAEQLATCPVPDETLMQEVGEPLFTRTVTKALATTTATVTAVKEPPLSVASFFSSARTVTLVGYRAAAVTGGWPRTVALLGFGFIAAGIVAMTLDVAVVGLAGAGFVAAGLLLVSLAAWGWRRWLLPAVAGLAVLAAAGCVTIWRDDLFGKGDCNTECKDIGWVGQELWPLLREEWWQPLVGLIVLSLLAGLLSGAVVIGARAGGSWWKRRQDRKDDHNRRRRTRHDPKPDRAAQHESA
ncbi:patatin-like protein [Streptomyces lunaelactis]|uniref:patatin-like protein n=1 Tax=Streptomyces lunaelactis TaxID=1535768 RepID=UPI001584AD2E|nr:patatin-like protein [Streptomyces lunaelactis]NUK16856.1 patatin-like protein [Streptomyces lunaelactis]